MTFGQSGRTLYSFITFFDLLPATRYLVAPTPRMDCWLWPGIAEFLLKFQEKCTARYFMVCVWGDGRIMPACTTVSYQSLVQERYWELSKAWSSPSCETPFTRNSGGLILILHNSSQPSMKIVGSHKRFGGISDPVSSHKSLPVSTRFTSLADSLGCHNLSLGPGALTSVETVLSMPGLGELQVRDWWIAVGL